MASSNGNGDGNGKGREASEVTATKLSARQIPTLAYTFQNIIMSAGTIISSLVSLFFTVSIILPLSILRGAFPAQSLALIPPQQLLKTGKVVFIVGGSHGIGFEVLKKYAIEPDTTIIATSKPGDALRDAIIGLGDTPATIQIEQLDLANSPRAISQAVEVMDEKYGPISHIYVISGISNQLRDSSAWKMDTTEALIKVNVMGTIALSLAMYEKMKSRRYGKICIVGTVASIGIHNPENTISYASTKSFMNTFSTSLRVLASASNVDVITVEPGLINTRMTHKMRGQGSSVPAYKFESAECVAEKMKVSVEMGGVGIVSWPLRQSVMMYAFRGLNPICEEIGKWASMKSGKGGKKIT